ncbi:MAG: hypothetical protein R3A79_22470 [Nannocystaceae bacterium]
MLRTRSLALALVVALAPACKSSPGGTKAETGGDAAAPGQFAVTLPSPHPLEERPPIAAFVRDPAAALDVASATLPGVPPLMNVAALLIATQAPADLAERLAPHVADRRPWAGARVAGEDILFLPLRDDGVDAAAAALEGYPTATDFGAVELPGIGLDVDQLAGRPASAGDSGDSGEVEPRLAWVDRESGALAIARTPAGLVTGRELVKGYARSSVWIHAEGELLRAYLEDFPYARVGVKGDGLDNLKITIEADPQRGLPSIPEIAPGALANLHSGPELALAGSTRYARYEAEVRELIRQINAQVNAAGFAAKMMLEPLAKQASAVLRAWNGRVFVGIGPKGHLALGLGADEPLKAGAALTRFLRTAIDNLELARMFTSSVPKLSLRRHSTDPEIHVLTVKGAAKLLPPAAAALIDGSGGLRIAFSFSAKSGAVFAMIGADAETKIAAWAAAIEAAPPASESDGDLIAATVALSPAQLQALLSRADLSDANALITAGIDLGAGRPPTQLILRQEADRYVITSKGPASAVPSLRKGREG